MVAELLRRAAKRYTYLDLGCALDGLFERARHVVCS